MSPKTNQFSGVPLSVSGICYNALSERQSKSSNNLQRVHKDLLAFSKGIPVMQITDCLDKKVITNHQLASKCSPDVSPEVTPKPYDWNCFF